MTPLRKLKHDNSGATIIEFAIALPVLVLTIYGIFTSGMLLMANAGVQHALGEAARHATLFPTPSDDEIKAKVAAKKFGLGNGTLQPASIVTDTANHHKTITLTYTQSTDFLFFKGPTVTVVKSKKVYVAD